MKKILTVSAFLMCQSIILASVIRTISLDEFNSVIMPEIEKCEKLIKNYEIEFEISGQQKPLNSASSEWKDSGYYSKVRLLSDGQKKGKIKIDVLEERRGLKVTNSKSYSLCYNGQKGKILLHGKSSKGETSEIKEYEILSTRADTIKSEVSAGLYEKPFLLKFLAEGTDLSFSEYLKMFMKPEIDTSSKVSRKIDLVKFENSESVRIQIEASAIGGGVRNTYWLDPAKNYAPLAYETVSFDENGKELSMTFKKVLEFRKIATDIWFPVKTLFMTKMSRIETKKTLIVSEVRVNIEDLEDVDFDLNIPDDYKMIDKTAENSFGEKLIK